MDTSSSGYLPSVPPLPTAYSPPRSARARLTAARARVYARHLLALATFALFATALTYRAGPGLNVPSVCGGLIGLGLFRASGRGGWRAALAVSAVRWQLIGWAAVAIATVAHFDTWTTVSLLLATVLLSATLLTGATDPFRALSRGVIQLIIVIAGYVHAWRLALRWGRYRSARGVVDVGRLLIPAAVTAVFAVLYVASSEALSVGWERLVAWLAEAFWSEAVLIGLVASAWAFAGAGFLFVPQRLRKVLRSGFGESPPAVAGTSSTWTNVSLTLAMVNALALVLNVSDVFTTWLSEPSASGTILKRGVHEGTWTLVVAILAAAAVMGYGFRQNPPDVLRARRLAVAWLAQNAIMALTVGLRNYHYVDAYGLTYKRVGVYLFLACALAGLYLLGRKIWRAEGFEALVRRQAWVVYGVLATAALCNWPGLITRYNLSPERFRLDRNYMKVLRPYNLSVWAELDPAWFHRELEGAMWGWNDWMSTPADWRDWDYGEARRAALLEGYGERRNVDER